MKEMIDKNSLDQSIDLVSELNLNETDFGNIYEKFKTLLKEQSINKVIKKISNGSEIHDEDNLKEIMKALSDKVELKELQHLLNIIIKNEDLIDFIQDLFLEKLI